MNLGPSSDYAPRHLRVTIVVPCYNEGKRWSQSGLEALAAAPHTSVLLVDDGSTDDTRHKIERLVAERPEEVSALLLDENRGKAEAVRRGLLTALEGGAEVVGYFDADLSTPPEEMLRLCDSLTESGKAMVLGARVRMLGHRIARRGTRHYLGRLFGTCASLALGLPVYDTQCGAKALRPCKALEFALASPFSSRWAFDVELMMRLLTAPEQPLGPDDFLEVPLRRWEDRAGSKLTATAMAKAGFDLLWLALARRGESSSARK